MRISKTPLALALSGGVGFSAGASAVTTEELVQRIERLEQKHAQRLDQLEAENAQLKAENDALKAETQETRQQVETNTAAVEAVNESFLGMDRISRWFDKMTIGGYGELQYNHLSNEPGSLSGDPFRQLDLHRFVLFFGWEFTERWRFYSEVEYEHNTTGSGFAGEVELEQAYLQYDIVDQPWGVVDGADVVAGVYLVPIGILNLVHEPPTFYGVERNDVETVIIPTTWWEGGIGSTVNFARGISLDLGVTSGLKLPGTGSNAFRIRSGRQKVSEATVNDGAYTTRLKYTGVPGLSLAAAFHYEGNMGQGETPGLGAGKLYETDAIWNYNIGPGAFTFKGLYAIWNIDGARIRDFGGNVQYGWYLEPSYRFPIGAFGELGFYGRYEKVRGWRFQDRFQQWEGGFNWWPIEDIVFKFDVRAASNDVDRDFNYSGFDLGIGYQF